MSARHQQGVFTDVSKVLCKASVIDVSKVLCKQGI